MNSDVSVNVGSAILYLQKRVLELFGKDADTRDFHKWLNKHIQITMYESSLVRCVGIGFPIPIGEIYEPVRLFPLSEA